MFLTYNVYCYLYILLFVIIKDFKIKDFNKFYI